MNFESFQEKDSVMKNYIIMAIMLLTVSSCSMVRTADSSAGARRAARLEATRESVEKSMQSGKYLIRMDRLEGSRALTVNLSPQFNYIIVDQGMVRMKLGYIGRQYDFRGIAAINMSARSESYELFRDEDKNSYEIKIKARQAGELFDILLSIDDRGNCTARIYNNRIESVRYRGHLFIETI
jgi:hypothetical protein